MCEWRVTWLENLAARLASPPGRRERRGRNDPLVQCVGFGRHFSHREFEFLNELCAEHHNDPE
jgi:hypothetical protein